MLTDALRTPAASREHRRPIIAMKNCPPNTLCCVLHQQCAPLSNIVHQHCPTLCTLKTWKHNGCTTGWVTVGHFAGVELLLLLLLLQLILLPLSTTVTTNTNVSTTTTVHYFYYYLHHFAGVERCLNQIRSLTRIHWLSYNTNSRRHHVICSSFINVFALRPDIWFGEKFSWWEQTTFRWASKLEEGRSFDIVLGRFISDDLFIGPRCPWSDLCVRMSQTNYMTLCRLNWCDSGWWGYQLNTNW